MAHDLFVGITTWNSAAFLPHSLAALRLNTDERRTRVMILDNFSTDATVAIARGFGAAGFTVRSLDELDEALRQTVLLGARDVFLDELLGIARQRGLAETLLQTAVSNLPASAAGIAHMLADAPAARAMLEQIAQALRQLEASLSPTASEILKPPAPLGAGSELRRWMPHPARVEVEGSLSPSRGKRAALVACGPRGSLSGSSSRRCGNVQGASATAERVPVLPEGTALDLTSTARSGLAMRRSRQDHPAAPPGRVNARRSDAGWVPREINCTAGWWDAGRSWRWHCPPS